jgi:hypothetical protein
MSFSQNRFPLLPDMPEGLAATRLRVDPLCDVFRMRNKSKGDIRCPALSRAYRTRSLLLIGNA